MLGEPIKVGHHSERRHRNLIERNQNRFRNAMEELAKVSNYEDRIAYWESKASEINLSMPESIDFYTQQLQEATEYHAGMKDGTIPRLHSMALQYAKKRVNDLKKKVETAKILWA